MIDRNPTGILCGIRSVVDPRPRVASDSSLAVRRLMSAIGALGALDGSTREIQLWRPSADIIAWAIAAGATVKVFPPNEHHGGFESVEIEVSGVRLILYVYGGDQ